MAEKISLGEAEQLVKLARKSIEYFLAAGRMLSEQAPSEKFEKKQGVFVTLHSFPKHELRGCIGLPYPVAPLWNAVIHAATSAAFDDPRFMQLQASELEEIVVEISILTVPEEIAGSKKELLGKIEAGKDGLIVRKGARSGLLLPQVAKELNCDAKEFLGHTCRKATLPETAWRDSSCKVFKFRAQVFKEREPNGNVIEEEI